MRKIILTLLLMSTYFLLSGYSYSGENKSCTFSTNNSSLGFSSITFTAKKDDFYVSFNGGSEKCVFGSNCDDAWSYNGHDYDYEKMINSYLSYIKNNNKCPAGGGNNNSGVFACLRGSDVEFYFSNQSGLNCYPLINNSNTDSNSPGGNPGTVTAQGTNKKCYNPNATSCVQYPNVETDLNKQKISIEVGESKSGNYFVISYDNFQNGWMGYGLKSSVETSFGDSYSVEESSVYDKTSGSYGSITIDFTKVDNGYTRYFICRNSGCSGDANFNLADVNGSDDVLYGDTNVGDDYGYSHMDCYGLLGSPDDPNNPSYWLQKGLEIMRYAAIIALVGLSTADFIKAISAQDQDAIKKAVSTTMKRFMYAIIIFFIPIVTEFIMNLFGVYGTCSL